MDSLLISKTKMELLKLLTTILKACWRFSVECYQKCQKDELTIIAGHLAFVTLLSFVPFVTVVLGVFSALDVFDDAKHLIENFLFNQFVPNTGAEVQNHIVKFMDNIGKMTGISLAALVVIAVMLLKNIDKELNRIFVTDKRKPFWKDLLIYLLVIVVGPILIGISVAATSAFMALEWIETVAGWLPTNMLNASLPIFFSFLYFLLLYRIVPIRSPSSNVAIVGAIITSLLFELSKYIFSLYISLFPTYQVIYGSLASIPIFFLWVYFNWLIVLFGAEFTCVLDDNLKARRSIINEKQ
ncbi:YihY family inner membrane protein [Catenovulum sp. 2E275]|uniref:YihY family inner membrane protein n=1 Tax=Catenovulum sp. 2E275 TaxID=2980497 RepID=UPI0021D16389|nr:YihY family inner membrane protein [Catenovulum sp. 2E275]MCU4676848.1 YihY family inner membrane protein [Catenovulum sp. 2E275]